MAARLGKVISEGVAWVSAGSVVNKVIGVAYVALVLSHLSVYEYGVVELLLSIPPLLGILNLPGLEPVITADLSREKGVGNYKKIRYIVESYFCLRSFLAVVAWALLFFSAPLVEIYYNQNISTMVMVLSFTFLSSPLRTMYTVVFRTNLQYKFVAIYRFTEEAGKLVILAFALLWLDWGPLSVIVAYVGADVVALTLLSFPFLKHLREVLGPRVRTGGWKDPFHTIKAHGKWSIFGSYLEKFGQNIRPWIIKFFLGTQAVGIYALAMGMYQNTGSLLPISQVITPILPRYLHDKPKLFMLINSAIKYKFLAYVVVCLIMAAVVPVIIHLFFPDYSDAYPLFIGFLVATVPSSFSGIFQVTFVALQAQKSLFFANVLRLSTILVFLPISLYLVGFYGIALELFITRSFFAFNRYQKLLTLLPGYRLSLLKMFTITSTDRMLWQKVRKKLRLI